MLSTTSPDNFVQTLVTVFLTGVPPITTYGESRFTPSRVEVRWHWSTNHGWLRSGFEVHGQHLRKQGTHGVRELSRWEAPTTPDEWRLPDEWRELAESTRPQWTPFAAAEPVIT